MSALPYERLEISTTSEHAYNVAVFRNIEAVVDEASDVVCIGGLDIADMAVEHDETEDEEKRRIAQKRRMQVGAHASY